MNKKTEKKPTKKAKSHIKLNKKAFQALQQEKDELFEKLQRISADYANFQKRGPKQIADSVAYEKERFIKSILPAMDNLEHTRQNANVSDVDTLIKAIEMIYEQLLDILKAHNVAQIHAKGEIFNPELHQAMLQQQDPDQEDNVVLEDFQKGYKLNGRVIRPSNVIVNKLADDEIAPPQSTDSISRVIYFSSKGSSSLMDDATPLTNSEK